MAEIIKNSLNNKVKEDFLSYANAVIKSRAIPKVEDNLKPVHRRVLYTMAEKKLWSNKAMLKCANVVGGVMSYHPHGDTAIYDSLIRLGQEWKMRYPLVEIGGNGGSILGDSAAAMRYTECRLSPLGELMLEDLSEESVNFKPNYDETSKEPMTLPSKFPNLLCNGNAGIAVGLSSSLVPHNLSEVVDGIVAYIGNPAISIDELMKHIPGPDFPTGGIITDKNRLKEIYAYGSGAVTLQGKYNLEKKGNKQVIHFTEVPYLINVEDGIVKKIKEMVIEDGFDLIEDYDNDTNKDGIDLRIYLKKGANVYKVLERLFKDTRLQSSQRISNTIIVDGMPRVLSLKEMISNYVEYRNKIILNIYQAKLRKVLNRIEVVEGLLIAMKDIDKIINLIKQSSDRKDAKEKLMKQFSEVQANSILNMKLSSLSKLDKEDLKIEFDELQKKKNEYSLMVKSSDKRNELIVKELKEIKAKYGDERKTKLGGTTTAAVKLSKEPVNIVIFETGNLYVTQNDLTKLPLKLVGDKLNKEGSVKEVKKGLPIDTFAFFTRDGHMENFDIKTFTIDELEPIGLSENFVNAINIEKSKKEYLIFITKNGKVKKTSMSEYLKARKRTKAINLKADDELIYVGACNNDDMIYILGEDGKLVKFPASEVNNTSRITIGSKGINGAATQALVAAKSDKIFTMNNKDQAKLTEGEDYITTARGSNGQSITDGVVSLLSGEPEYLIAYDGKKNNLIKSKDLAVKGKTSVGAKISKKKIIGIGN